MLTKTAPPVRLARGLGCSRLSAFPQSSTQQQRRVIVRFKENDKNIDALKEELEQQLQQDAQAQDLRQQPLQPLFTPSEPKLSPQQIKEVRDLLLLLLLTGMQCVQQRQHVLSCCDAQSACHAPCPLCTTWRLHSEPTKTYLQHSQTNIKLFLAWTSCR
jgi:hypothetical protein